MTTQPEEHTPVISQGTVADTPDGHIPVGHTLPDGEALLAVRNLKGLSHRRRRHRSRAEPDL